MLSDVSCNLVAVFDPFMKNIVTAESSDEDEEEE